MKVWDSCGRVFGANPDWVVKAIDGVKDLWAPDIVFHNGKYYLYYAASTMICVPTSLSQEVGTALGAQAGEARLREVILKGGFKSVRRAAETPFNMIIEARP